MFKNKDFDYDLWTMSDGKKWARVKSTGEVCEISNDTMKILRCEEKRMYQELDLKKSLESENDRKKQKPQLCILSRLKSVMMRTTIPRGCNRMKI